MLQSACVPLGPSLQPARPSTRRHLWDCTDRLTSAVPSLPGHKHKWHVTSLRLVGEIALACISSEVQNMRWKHQGRLCEESIER